MITTTQLPAKDSLPEWKDFFLDLKKIFAQGRSLLLKHNEAVTNYKNPGHDIDDIIETEKVVIALFNAGHKFQHYEKAFSAVKSAPELQYLAGQITAYRILATKQLIELAKVLADKYACRPGLCKTYDEKKSAVSKAYEWITVAVNLREALALQFVMPTDISLEVSMKKISAQYLNYLSYEEKPKTEIEVLLKQAYWIKNPDKAAAIYDQALKLAIGQKDIDQQFYISCLKSEKLSAIFTSHIIYFKNSADVELAQKRSREICTPLLFAIDLARNNMLYVHEFQYETLCYGLYVAAEFLLTVTYACIFIRAKDKRESLLEQANFYLKSANEFTTYINKTIPRFDYLNESCKKLGKILETEKKQKLEAELKKEKAENDLVTATNNYIKELPNLTLSIESLVNNTPKKNTNRKKKNPSQVTILQRNQSPVFTPTKELVKAESEPKYSAYLSNGDVDIDKNKYLLTLATEKNDVKGQIIFNSNISDGYRINAFRTKKDDIDARIKALDTALFYLLAATELLTTINTINEETENMKSWVEKLLDETRTFLNNTKEEQQNLQTILDMGRELAMAAMESKGKSWFKDLDQQFISDEAKLRQATERRVKKLENMEKKLDIADRSISNLPKENSIKPGF